MCSTKFKSNIESKFFYLYVFSLNRGGGHWKFGPAEYIVLYSFEVFKVSTLFSTKCDIICHFGFSLDDLSKRSQTSFPADIVIVVYIKNINFLRVYVLIRQNCVLFFGDMFLLITKQAQCRPKFWKSSHISADAIYWYVKDPTQIFGLTELY